MKMIIFALLIASVPFSSIYQADVISGTVSDASDGSAMVGVSVQWKGTSTGVVTKPLKIKMKAQDSEDLAEVIVTGYAIQKRESSCERFDYFISLQRLKSFPT